VADLDAMLVVADAVFIPSVKLGHVDLVAVADWAMIEGLI
jgi:hypothetical protein